MFLQNLESIAPTVSEKKIFEEKFFKNSLKIEKLFFHHRMNKLEKGPPKECPFKIWSQSHQQFWRRSHLKEKLTDDRRRTTDTESVFYKLRWPLVTPELIIIKRVKITQFLAPVWPKVTGAYRILILCPSSIVCRPSSVNFSFKWLLHRNCW